MSRCPQRDIERAQNEAYMSYGLVKNDVPQEAHYMHNNITQNNRSIETECQQIAIALL